MPTFRRRARPRVAVAGPPSEGGGFDEMHQLGTREYASALRSAGADVTVLTPDAGPVRRGSFDFVTSPMMNYVLAASVEPTSWVASAGIPATMVWDDPLGGLALWSEWKRRGTMGWLNDEPADGDVLADFRSVMSSPGVQHFGWDSGHIDAVASLGLAEVDSIEWRPQATYTPYFAQGRIEDIEPTSDLSFSGNLYESLLAKSNFAADAFFVELTDRIVRRKLTDLEASSWEIFRSEIDAIPEPERDRRGLLPARTPFWDYYLYAVWFALTSKVRMKLLGEVAHPVDLFGLFADPETRALLGKTPNLRFRGHRQNAKELPQTYASTKINLCITNGLIYRGVPSKLIECLASGGFALVDPKPDLIRLFGPDAEAIFFRDGDELNAKIEHFLVRPEERREIVETFRPLIVRELNADAYARRILERRGYGL